MLNLYMYKAHLFSPDVCRHISTCNHKIFPKYFFTCSFPFFFADMKYQNGLNHRDRDNALFQYINI